MGKNGEFVPKFNLVGQRFDKLTVVEYAGYKTGKTGIVYHQWKCKCECGGEKIATTRLLMSCHCRSCGCIPHTPKTMPQIKHNMSGTRLYNVWKSIKGRCYTKSCAGYEDYGGRGIKMCDEWKNDFMAFYKWAIEHGYDENAPRGAYTIERIDVNGDYEPSNCKWIPASEQGMNKRDSVFYMYDGELLTLRQIAEKADIPLSQLKGRIDRGLSLYEALYNEYESAQYYYEINGERHSIPEWSKISGIKEITIRARLNRGWDITKAVFTPTNEKGRDLWKTRKRFKQLYPK